MLNNASEIINATFARHQKAIEDSLLQIKPQIEKGAEVLFEALKDNHRLFACGNGGSAADSQHFSGEWLCRFKGDRRPLPGMSLTVDSSTLTAIGNDYDFESVFSRQLEALGSTGDVLVAFTTSGQSKNVLKTIAVAKAKGIKVIALTGQKGASLESSVDVAIVVPSEETARIQEVHELVYHTWCEIVDSEMKVAGLI